MKYKESETVELKRELKDDVKLEIIAFLNSYLGGTIFVGVDNQGKSTNVTENEKDLYESKVINWIRDEAIYPNCSDFISVFYNEDGVLEINY